MCKQDLKSLRANVPKRWPETEKSGGNLLRKQKFSLYYNVGKEEEEEGEGEKEIVSGRTPFKTWRNVESCMRKFCHFLHCYNALWSNRLIDTISISLSGLSVFSFLSMVMGVFVRAIT